MYKLAVGWMVWKLTYSTAWLGVFGMLDQAPTLLVMPFAGAMTDRIDALKMLRITQILFLAQGVLLAGFDYFEIINIPILIVFTIMYGILNAFQMPANQAILPNLLPREDLTVAYGLNSVAYNIARLVGPMLAGLTINAWGTAPSICCNAIGAIIFSICLFRLQADFKIQSQASKRAFNMLGDIRDGVVYTLRHRGIKAVVITVGCLSMLPYSIDLILPSIADGVYEMGSGGLAWMTAILGVGAMVQASLIARRDGVSGLSLYALSAILWMAIAFCALAFTSNFWVALVFVFVIGFSSSATRVSSMTLLQYSVEPHMRGRVASIYGMITHFGPALGAVIVGFLGDRLGLPLVLGCLGFFSLAVWAWAFGRRHDMAQTLEVEAHIGSERRS
jgi:MFS family permease